MTQTIEQLQARVTELEADNVKWKLATTKNANCIRDQQKQLAAAQAEIKRLRDALDAVQQVANSSDGIAGWHLNGDIATWDSILPEVEEALAQPSDTSALDAYVAEKVKEKLIEMNYSGTY